VMVRVYKPKPGASADGTLLPPYVCYKATGMWSTWCRGGACGVPFCTQRCCKGGMRYGRTQHGWFDGSSTNQLEAVIDSVIQINLDDFDADGGDDESFDDEY